MVAQNSLIFNFVGIDKGVSKTVDRIQGKLVAVGKLAAGAAAAGAALFAAKGVKSFLEFDDQMTQSLAIMGEVSGPMRKQMEEAARAVGTSTRFGASEAAESYFFLASAGLDAEQSIAALPQVAAFAQAGMFDLATATDLATDAQSALGLSVDDPAQNLANLTRVTDTLVGANTLANASVEQFSTSLTQKAGPAMRQAGIEIEEGVAALAVFADQGIKAERAGTLFGATLEQLQRQAIQNSDEFEKFNVRVFDQQGNMRNLADIVGDLEGALGGMSLEQQKATLLQLGFNRSALDGIMALLGSSDALREYQGELENAAGTTQDVADKQMQSFAARLDLLKSAATDASISLGETLVNAAFDAGATAAEMKDIFDDLPPVIQGTSLAVAGITATAPLAIAAYGKVKAAIEAVRIAYGAMTTAGKVATVSLGAAGLLLAAGATVLGFFAQRNVEAKQRVDALADSLDKQTGAITENSREIAFNNLEQSGAVDKAKELGISLETLVNAYLGEQAAIDEVNAALADNLGKTEERLSGSNSTVAVLTDEAKAARDVSDAVLEGNSATDEAIVKTRDRRAAGLDAAAADEEMAGAVEQATGTIEDQSEAVDELTSELDELVKSVFAARDAEVDYEAALDDATAAIEENGKTLDVNTEKGRNNRTALDRVARAALDQAAAMLENGASHEVVEQKMGSAREAFIKTARQMGLNKQEAGALADELGLIPGNYRADVTVRADTGDAFNAVNEFTNWVSKQGATVNIVGRMSERAMAEGGFARRGEVALVGEEGPELVAFARDAHVTPADETQRLLRGGGSGGAIGSGGGNNYYVTVNMPFGSTKQDVENGIVSTLQSLDRQGRVTVKAR